MVQWAQSSEQISTEVHTICRYHKYKGRFTDLAQAYKDLEAENQKVKDVMQQTQVGDVFIIEF